MNVPTKQKPTGGLRRKVRVLLTTLMTFFFISVLAIAIYAGKSTIGDFVWHDTDADGVYDAGELGIDGVIVNLYQDGANGQPEDGIITAAELISTTTTAATSPTSNYLFDVTGGTQVDPELYRVEIAPENFDPGGALENYVYTGDIVGDSQPRDRVISQIVTDLDDVDFPYALASLDMVKTAGNAADGAIEYVQGPAPVSVVYTYTVVNDGDVALSLDAPTYGITDDKCSAITGPQAGGDANANGLLDPGETWVFTCTQLLELVDLDASGQITNTAVITGNPIATDEFGAPIDDPNNPGFPLELPGNDPTDTDLAVVDVVNPAITLAKTIYEGHNAGASCPGDELVVNIPATAITYCFVVENTGDTDIEVDITDPTLDLTNIVPALSPATVLAPGESATFYVQTAITVSQINTATATGTPVDPDGNVIPDIAPVEESDTAEVRVADQPAAIGDLVWYDADQDGYQDVGEPGIGNVTMELWIDDGDGIFNPALDTLLGSTDTSGTDGGYIFTGLDPDEDYFVRPAPDEFLPGGTLEGYTQVVGGQAQPADPPLLIAVDPPTTSSRRSPTQSSATPSSTTATATASRTRASRASRVWKLSSPTAWAMSTPAPPISTVTTRSRCPRIRP